MKKILFNTVLIVPLLFIFYGQRNTFGMDRDGCLTCHQYPGLVRLEPPDTIKVLHINEEKFRQSPHGKLNCRDCHTQILQVPHTGVTAVDCATRCHLDEKENIRSKIVPLSAFHRKEQSYIVRLDSESACNICHSIYPHSNNKLVRALLNMHTGFALCEVCHLEKARYKGLFYGWKSPEEVTFKGEPFGSFYKPQVEAARSGDHLISRIAVFLTENNRARIIEHKKDIPRAIEFLRTEKRMNSDQKDRQLNYFHRDTARKEISVACNECHSENSILDFRKLGFNENKAHNLKTLGIKGLVTKYKTFYFPHLFDQ